MAPSIKHMIKSSSHTFQGIMRIDVDDHAVLAMLQAQALNVRAVVVELHGDLATAAKKGLVHAFDGFTAHGDGWAAALLADKPNADRSRMGEELLQEHRLT